MPGPYYRRRVGPVDLLLLNSNDVDRRQTAWLRGALAEARGPWKVAVFHHPVHTCGKYQGKDFDVDEWVPMFERAGVQLVLNGHDHNYQRFEDGPITYVVVGGGGASLYPLETCAASGTAGSIASESVHSFLSLRVTDQRIEARALAIDGRLLDRFTVQSS